MNYRQQMMEWAKRREAIQALRDKQWSWTEIAKRYRITPQRAQQLGKRNGKKGAP